MTTPLPKTYPEPVWTDDLDPFGRETQTDLESLEQDVLHIIGQRRGSNTADPTKGGGAFGILSGDASVLADLPHQVDADLRQMTRVDASNSTIEELDDGTQLLRVTVSVAGQVVRLNYVIGPDGVQLA